MPHLRKVFWFVFLFSVIGLSVVGLGWTKSSELVLEWEQHWETYGVGGTCNFGTHNFFVGDVDDDGVMEMVTGGFMYENEDYSWNELQAPMRIWNWDGTNFHNEEDYYWPGMISSICAGDADGDGATEIITAGMIVGGMGGASIRIWSWNNENLTLRAEYVGLSATAMFISDVNQDGSPEILTIGSSGGPTGSVTKLRVLKWNGNNTTVERLASAETQANSVYACDLNNDGVTEIVTGGYSNNITESSGQLCIWHFSEDTLSFVDSTEWQTEEEGYGVGIAGSPMGNTMVNSLKVGDVDDDGIPEIVAGGFSYHEQKVDAQLTIWNWGSQSFVLEADETWQSQDITEVKSLSLNDVDGDGSLDIINSGFIGAYEGWGDETVPPEQAQVGVWSWDGENLEFIVGKDWDIGEGVTAWNVGTGDVDNDGTTEIITIGCMYISSLCDPDLRIWSIAEEQENPPEQERPPEQENPPEQETSPEQESPSEQESTTDQGSFPFDNLLLVVLIIAVAALLIVVFFVLRNRINRKPSETFS